MSTNSGEPSFAARLREARKARGLSQSDLARRLGTPPSAIAHFEGERRKPSFASVRAIARALDVSADYLLGRAPTMEGATTAFRNEEKLTAQDREFLQQLIDQMTEKRRQGP